MALSIHAEAALLFAGVVPSALTPVKVCNIEPEIFELMRPDIEFKACYSNALLIGLSNGADAVAFGFAYSNKLGFAFEHAWIRLDDGSYYDPTYQNLDGIEEFEYYLLVDIALDDYGAVSRRLHGSDRARFIDLFTLRRSGEYEAAFKADFSEALKEIRQRTNESITQQ